MFNIVTEESFDLNNSVQYSLSIQVSLDGFSFSVTPSEEKTNVLAYGNFPITNKEIPAENLKQFLASHELFTKPFHRRQVICFLPGFSLIPEEYHDSNLKGSEIVSQQVRKKAIERISTKVNNINSQLNFYVPGDIHNILIEKLGTYEYIHPAQLMIESMPHESGDSRLILLYGASLIYIVVFESQRLLTCNSYVIANNDDVLYHVLNTLTQLKLNPHDLDFIYLESISRNNKLENALKPFFRKSRRFGKFVQPDNQNSYRESIHFCFN